MAGSGAGQKGVVPLWMRFVALELEFDVLLGRATDLVHGASAPEPTMPSDVDCVL